MDETILGTIYGLFMCGCLLLGVYFVGVAIERIKQESHHAATHDTVYVVDTTTRGAK